MFCFTAYNITLEAYQNIFDLALFHPNLFHIHFQYSFNMARFFEIFNVYSANVYFSLFLGYLILQLALKYKSIDTVNIKRSKNYLYREVRINYYVGLSIFLVPAFFSFIANNSANIAAIF